MVATVMVVMLVMDRTGQNCHLNLTFLVTCDWQLSQFLRCFLECPTIFFLELLVTVHLKNEKPQSDKGGA